MLAEVYIGPVQKRFRPDPSLSIGKGGEADIFDTGDGRVLKLFKPQDHPDLQGMPTEQDAARKRIEEHQKKLLAFPTGLPSQIVAPVELAYLKDGSVAGYTMPFKSGAEVILRYSEVVYRRGITDDVVTRIFKGLHSTLHAVHDKGVIIGDFNDLNVLVKEDEAFIIDADSAQFGRFLCRVFTERFVDPLHCDPQADKLLLKRPHTESSDWYAFAVMLMQTLLCLAGGPYGGVYKPKEVSKRIGHSSRPLQRITVFHPDVRYPKPSRHFDALPDSLLQFFHQTFVRDKRDTIPASLLDLHWTTCSKCSMLHARGLCPHCHAASPHMVKMVSTGKVSAEKIFRTEGQILHAASQENTLRWLYHHAGTYRREDNSVVVKAPLEAHARFRIMSKDTVIAGGNQALVFTPGVQSPHRFIVDTFGSLPVVDANERHVFWAQGGTLKRTSDLGHTFQESIGDVLRQQTLFWVGQHIGFGFYRAGGISQCFIFNPKKRGINNSLSLQPFKGQLIDSTCFFGKDKVWFLVSNRVSGKTINSCYLIRHDGSVEASAETEAHDGSWLGTIRGKCVVGDFLLGVTDDGLVRVKGAGGSLGVEKEFPDSAQFVDTDQQLFIDKTGLMVVGHQEIWRLKIT